MYFVVLVWVSEVLFERLMAPFTDLYLALHLTLLTRPDELLEDDGGGGWLEDL